MMITIFQTIMILIENNRVVGLADKINRLHASGGLSFGEKDQLLLALQGGTTS